MDSKEAMGKPQTNQAMRPAKDFLALSSRILQYTGTGSLLHDFLRQLSETMLKFSECESLEIAFAENKKFHHYTAVRGSAKDSDFRHRMVSKLPPPGKRKLQTRGPTALLRLDLGPQTTGTLTLRQAPGWHFCAEERELYQDIARKIGIALMHRRTQVLLRERVKELVCLYGVAQLVSQPALALDEILRQAAKLLPPAWLYPEIASARIVLDGTEYATPGFTGSGARLAAEIAVNGAQRGLVEVCYSQEKPELDDGPFLNEERSLLKTVSHELGLFVERREAEREKVRAEEQLRHADRLATIGQLSAGIAHELNEPLGGILGFAQLLKKAPETPEALQADLDRIVKASLHAREIVRKLLVFARQMPPQRTSVSLNTLVNEAASLLESRCEKEGVRLVCTLSPTLPSIVADPSQLRQVVVNLLVNGVQALSKGGKLTVQTLAEGANIVLVVEDTGVGMSEEVLKQIFVPFFTTKGPAQGTGLGLSVVHGIVTSHGGSITVQSQPGRGSHFEVRLPVNTGAEQGKKQK